MMRDVSDTFEGPILWMKNDILRSLALNAVAILPFARGFEDSFVRGLGGRFDNCRDPFFFLIEHDRWCTTSSSSAWVASGAQPSNGWLPGARPSSVSIGFHRPIREEVRTVVRASFAAHTSKAPPTSNSWSTRHAVGIDSGPSPAVVCSIAAGSWSRDIRERRRSSRRVVRR